MNNIINNNLEEISQSIDDDLNCIIQLLDETNLVHMEKVRLGGTLKIIKKKFVLKKQQEIMKKRKNGWQ